MPETINIRKPVTNTPKTNAKLKHISEFCKKPEQPNYLIYGILNLDTIGSFIGSSGDGKSFVMIDISCHVAHGLRWNNRKTKEGTVVYIAGEGANGLKKRFKAWHVFHGKEFKNIIISIVPFKLCEASQVKELIQHIKDILGETKPVMIVIDTLNRNFSANGGDENSTKDMSIFLDGCSQLRIETNACVIVIHHTGHNNKERGRGSNALFSGVDFEYLIEKTGEVKNNDCKSTITATKVKDDAEPEPIALKWNIQDTGWEEYNNHDELVPITSVVLTPTDYIEKPTKPETTQKQNIALDSLRKALINDGVEDKGVVSVTEYQWRQVAYAAGISNSEKDEAKKKAFGRARDTLIDLGKVKVSQGRYWIAATRTTPNNTEQCS
ncbi:MAG: AAA family ATPase [Caldilineaceae bacterium]